MTIREIYKVIIDSIGNFFDTISDVYSKVINFILDTINFILDTEISILMNILGSSILEFGLFLITVISVLILFMFIPLKMIGYIYEIMKIFFK